jgi:hypothetical protein
VNSLLIGFYLARRAETNPSVHPAEDTLRSVAHSSMRALPCLTARPAGDDVDTSVAWSHGFLLPNEPRTAALWARTRPASKWAADSLSGFTPLRTFTLLDPFVARVVGQPPPGHLVDILLAPGRRPTRDLQVLVVPRRALGRPQGRQSGYECLIRFAGRVQPRLRGSVPPGPGSAAPAASLTRSLMPGGGASSQRTLNLNHVAVELTDADLHDTAADVGDIHRCQATAPRLRDPAQDDGVVSGEGGAGHS